jgi:putative DNA primase/helicase
MNTDTDENTMLDPDCNNDSDYEDDPYFEDSTGIGDTSSTVKKVKPPPSFNYIIENITEAYISELDANNLPSSTEIECELLSRVNKAIAFENQMIPVIKSGAKGRPVREREPMHAQLRLTAVQIQMLVNAFHCIIRVDAAENNARNPEDLLGVYIDDPNHPNYGLYDTVEDTVYRLAKRYDKHLEKRKFEELLFSLRSESPQRTRCSDRDLIAVNNGLFNYVTKQLEPFSPDKVFLAKSRVNYVSNAVNPIITNPDNTVWDVESWMNTLSKDQETVDLLWQILSCIIRPYVRWNKCVWLYATTGNNGKGTLCLLMRNLSGAGTHTSIPLSDFNKEFALEPLVYSNAIIVDENNVGEFLDKSANLKAIITNDIVQINRKFRKPISFRFWGFMVQCINDLPRVKDKSDSFYRRQLTIPMDGHFTGKEREYIKDDYLGRKDVLE